MDAHSTDVLQSVLNHIHKLLHEPTEPKLPQELSENATLCGIHEYLIGLRSTLTQFSSGDFSRDITLRGVIAGRLKALQSNLRHMVWQVQQVDNGDFTQRVDFLGEFSQSFNHLVEQLDATLTAMRNKEQELLTLSRSLEYEVEQRNFTLRALEQSEAEFKYLAEHDSLTEVLNRRSFFDLAQREMMHAYGSKDSCCLALLDVDLFKRFNDTYGHLEGDCALKHVASISKAGLRQDDIMGRYGGEEFIFLFPRADLAQGMAVAERIRLSIAEQPVRIAQGEVLITASLGVTNILPDRRNDDFLQLLQRAIRTADLALYAAKDAGRNCVRFADLEAQDACLL